MRSIVYTYETLITLLVVFIIGCNPLGLPEQGEEYDVRGEVIAFVSPDTVQVGVPFRVQISYPNVCGGYFSRMWVYESASNEDAVLKITLSPIIHVVPQRVCPLIYSVSTVESQLQLNTIGRYELVADGRYGQLRKFMRVVSNHTPTNNFSIRFRFIDNERLPLAGYSTTFWLTDSGWHKGITIYSDQEGVWDTTFAYNSSVLKYNLDVLSFEAHRGITEDGVIILK